MELYPIKFEPIIIEKIWGGTKLKNRLNKEINTQNAGESWEISGIKNMLSIVKTGHLKGQNIHDVIQQFKDKLLGKKVYNSFSGEFPLLIKFIDAKDDLSVQVHPDDDTAKKRHQKNGKNEMWYMLDCDPGAQLILGVNKHISKEEYIEYVENKTISSVLNRIPVKKGDSAFIPAGRIHAIMKGVFLAEIQQTSDITYRIYDWDRPGLDGSFRELHTEEAKDVVELVHRKNYLIEYDKNLQNVELVKNRYFTVNRIRIDQLLHKTISNLDSFIVYMNLSETIEIKYYDERIQFDQGETILIPASLKEFSFHTAHSSEVLEIYI